MDWFKPTKGQKKKLKALIELGIKREQEKSLKEVKEVIESWENGKLALKDAYKKLYKTVEKNDNTIGKRYDTMKGSRYFTIVLSLLNDGIIERDELADLDEEARKRILEVYG